MKQIKICGLSKPEDIAVVNNLKPEYVGFVFAKSSRKVTKQLAMVLKALLDPSIKTVGVFVNESHAEIIEIVGANIIDVVQLHGNEDEEYIEKLRQNMSNEIIKSVSVGGSEEGVPNNVDKYLLDTFSEKEAGGTGKTFDLQLLDNLEINKPFFVAGGLTPENVTEIIDKVKVSKHKDLFCGVDISSGVETNGIKDSLKIEKFINEVRGMNND